MKLATLVLVGPILFLTASARAELIVNGGFETPVVSGGYTTFTAPSDAIAPWHVEAGSVDLVSASLYAPFEGNQSLDLNGLELGMISQEFSTVPGMHYELTFMYANNALVTSGSAIVAVMGHELLRSEPILHAGSTPSNMDYVAFRRAFQADAGQTMLRFTSTNDGRGGIALDAVSVRVVPEPSTVTMWCLAGLVGGLSFSLSTCGERHGRERSIEDRYPGMYRRDGQLGTAVAAPGCKRSQYLGV